MAREVTASTKNCAAKGCGQVLMTISFIMACSDGEPPSPHETDAPCAQTDALADLLCGAPVSALATVSTPDGQRLLAGDAHGRLYALERDGDAGVSVVESRLASSSFTPLEPILTCDLDRNGIDEIVLIDEGNAGGTLLWDGRLWDEDEPRSARVSSEDLWRVGCGDLDGDGAADLWGFPRMGSDLLVHRGTPQGFEEEAVRVALGSDRLGPWLQADLVRRPACGGSSSLLLAETARTTIELMDVDVGAREADEIGTFEMSASVRTISSQARGNEAAVALVQLIDDDASTPVLLSVLESPGCSEPFEELITLPFSLMRRMHPVPPRDPAVAEWIVVGDQTDGVALLAVEDGAVEIVRQWGVAAIDAVLVVPEPGGERVLAAAIADEPFLQWEPH